MVSLETYRKVVSDRPKKMSYEDVGFKSNTSDGYECGDCLHWYEGRVARRSVCEIYVGKGNDRMVPERGTCMFWTRNGLQFPKLDSKTGEPPE